MTRRTGTEVKEAELRERARHLAMMENPLRWPRWPILCLKKTGVPLTGQWPLFGCLADTGWRAGLTLGEQASTTPPAVVYQSAHWAETIQTGAEVERYETLGDLYDAGWRVD